MIKNYFRILKNPHAYLQAILKAHVKFQKDRPKTVGGVKGTRYLLKIWNHAPQKAENSIPPPFFEKAGDKKAEAVILVCDMLSGPVLHYYQVSPKYSKECST